MHITYVGVCMCIVHIIGVYISHVTAQQIRNNENDEKLSRIVAIKISEISDKSIGAIASLHTSLVEKKSLLILLSIERSS